MAPQNGWQKNLEANHNHSLTSPRPNSWWTGLAPETCPGFQGGALRSLAMPILQDLDHTSAQAYFDNSWTLTELLFSSLKGPDPFYLAPHHRLRHPLIFYYAHPVVFYVNKLRVAGLLEDAIDPYFEQIFEVGVDEMSWDDMTKNDMSWPSVASVKEYRGQVYKIISDLIAKHFESPRSVSWDDPEWALIMGMEHERIHIETSSVLIRELPLKWICPPSMWPPLHPSAAEQTECKNGDISWVQHEGASIVLGKDRDQPVYGWDNEYGHRSADVAPFRSSASLISNGAFLEFVKAGGYLNQSLWSEEGWNWRQHLNRKWPIFWSTSGPEGIQKYRLRTCFEDVDMPWSWPAIVNFHEAKAYCQWLSTDSESSDHFRLLTEAEHWCLRDPSDPAAVKAPKSDLVHSMSGYDLHTSSGPNFALAYGSETPVDMGSPNKHGIYDSRGNVWVWAEDHQHALDGFKIHPYYDDFTTPCFQGEHQMIFGGSFVSSGNEAAMWARYQFRPHFFQHVGFRVVCSPGLPKGAPVHVRAEDLNPYETDASLNQYLCLHYGSPEEQCPWPIPEEFLDFPKRTIDVLFEFVDKEGDNGLDCKRALDVGCAVGRSAFELARRCEEVIAVDLSQSFIETGKRLVKQGQMTVPLIVEGQITRDLKVVIDETIDRQRVEFRQADACALPPDFVGFDLVVLSNLLCRLPSPRACLGRMAGPRGLVRPGGLLFIASPYTWLEQFTPPGAWLGAQTGDSGKELRSAEVVKEFLEPSFELVHEDNMPAFFREHVRKYQLIFTHVTIWRRR
jgi:5-histidylcysteine sulfoxide synthase/putative 4-mercaptohistidine N1-methyltranferase